MDIKVLASSSKGNCYCISDGTSNLLIEAGISLKRIRQQVDLMSLSGCLITHEHKDHAGFAKDIAKYCGVYSSERTLALLNFGKYSYNKNYLKTKIIYTIKSFKIIAFSTQHDAIDPFGFLIQSTITKEKLLFATDTYYIKPRFKGLTYIMIECNYKKEILMNNLTKGKMLKSTVNRLLKSHFSLENVKVFLKSQDLSTVKKIYLLHLSDTNSDAELFKKEIQALTGKEVIVCEKEWEYGREKNV